MSSNNGKTILVIDDEAPNFLRKNLGWSYHAPCAGHEAIQLALGCTFRQSVDYLFPYYRDLCTSLAAGITPTEIIEQSTSGYIMNPPSANRVSSRY